MLFLSLTQHYIIYLIIFCRWGTKKMLKKKNYNKNTAVNSVRPPEKHLASSRARPRLRVCVCASRKQSSVHDRIFTLQLYLLSPAGSSGAFKGCKSNCFLHLHEHKYRGELGGKTQDTEAENSRNNWMQTRRSAHLSKEEQLIILSPFDSYLCIVAAQVKQNNVIFQKIIKKIPINPCVFTKINDKTDNYWEPRFKKYL